MINVTNQLRIFEINGSKLDHPEPPVLLISNHKNVHLWLVLKLSDSDYTYTVSWQDLEIAIKNVQNSNTALSSPLPE